MRDESNVIDECFMVRPNSTRSDTCSFLHKTGNHIVKRIINKKAKPCPVKFYHIIPEDLKNYLTARKLLTGSIIKAYLNRKQISDLHPSLNNQSKINYYIEKTRHPYIRSIRFLDNGQYIILCATKQQLKTIKELTYIEIDMAFKRIHAETYKNLFEDLFTCIEKDTGQALGLEQYLYSKYPIFSPIEHLQHIYKLCQVHYKRNIDKNKHLSQEIKDAIAMYLIPTLKIQGDVLRVLNNIQFCDEPGTEDWTKDKLIPWVLSGIIRGCDFDKRSWESIHVNQQYNVSDSYRNKSDLARSIQTEKRRKGKQPVLPSNKTKKKKNNSNENDENLQIDQQQNRVALEKLNIQKQINDELEREITLLEKRKQLMN
ncbi:hypothetical protein Glove_138g43 [Diversispora epigaea]|uniref:Uncharacterized protein n=1 Tax=Diversispora epigaea TaxID=1348612 RepID=A0A397J617_9GLOM|nr:hypothetical protein Glove_138g43 [Diversispora epigaea]